MDTPILDMLKKVNEENRTRFYMPGHKGGRLMGDWESLFSFDITEIEGADNLHEPSGAILKAEKAAARAFGADRTYFLVGGATAGIHAMLAAVAGDGDLVIMDRASHKSAIYASENCGATAVFLSPEVGEDGVSGSISPEKLRETLEEYPEAKAVYLTSPNYYGRCQRVRELAAVTHEKGIKLLVDEAHGAHFAFSRRLPETALSAGADAVVQSAHKTLPALTMSAYLHVKDSMGKEEIEEALRRFQSTSPSYLLMASLDYARAFMETHQAELEAFISDCAEIFDLEITPDRDVTRLVFTLSNMTGERAARLLREEYAIEAEMADACHVVLIPTMGNTREELLRLKCAMEKIASRPGEGVSVRVKLPEKTVLRMRRAKGATREVPIRESAGKVSAGMVYLYPPGIPLLLPGEEISEGVIRTMEEYRRNALSLHGAVNGENILIFE